MLWECHLAAAGDWRWAIIWATFELPHRSERAITSRLTRLKKMHTEGVKDAPQATESDAEWWLP